MSYSLRNIQDYFTYLIGELYNIKKLVELDVLQFWVEWRYEHCINAH